MNRVLHVVGDSKFGGGGVLILDLVEGGLREGYEVSVLTTDPVFGAKLAERGIRQVDIDVIRRPIRPLWDIGGLIRLWRYLRKNRYEIIHTHTSKAGFVGRTAARLARVPVIVHTVHGFAFHEQSGWVERNLYVWLERIASYACNRIITVSDHHLQEARHYGIGRSRQLLSIPNGLDPVRVRPTESRQETREALSLDPDQVAIVTIGRLAAQKGLEYALQALAKLDRSELPPFRLILAGDGPLAGSLRAMSQELGVDDLVDFLGFRNDVADLLNAADLVLMPSLWEGLSISLLEAMAARKAIITTSIPSNLEVTENGRSAVIVPPRAVDELATALSGLLGDPLERGRIASLAFERFESYYTSRRMVDAYLAEYRALLGSSAGR